MTSTPATGPPVSVTVPARVPRAAGNDALAVAVAVFPAVTTTVVGAPENRGVWAPVVSRAYTK